MRRSLASLFLTISLITLSFPSLAESFKVYMSPSGDDANDGLSLSSPVLTIYRVQKVLLAHRPEVDVEVHISPGTYYDQKVAWIYTNGHKITFTPLGFTNVRPVFDGNGDTHWFKLDYAKGRHTNLHFRYIKIQNYNTAISFNGDRDNVASGWNGGNSIVGMYFYRIGGLHSLGGASTAAVRLVNSVQNHITNNHFVSVENTDQTASAIHAIYLAHYSSSNFIERNKFVGVNGDPVKVRDASDENVINDNRFYSSGHGSYFQDSYCEPHRPECTKPTPECPSIGNQFRNNELHGGYYGNVRVFRILGADDTCGALTEPRLRTSGNTFPSGSSPGDLPPPPEGPYCDPVTGVCTQIP